MLLKIDNIEFAYTKDIKILKGISMSNKDNQLMSIVGVSGCGKSTLLKIIAGLLPNNGGNYFSGKISIDNQNPLEFRKTGKLSFMFQEPTLMPNLTVKENIQLPLQILRKQFNGKVDILLDMVGLSEYSNYLPKELSGGMKTRVALARSFISEPKLLLLDEPFTSLDLAWRTELYNELHKLSMEFNTFVIMVSHDINEAVEHSNRIIVMGKDGRIIGRSENMRDKNKHEQYLRELIIWDSRRNSININEAQYYLDILINAAGTILESSDIVEYAANIILKFSNQKVNYDKLVEIWFRSNSTLKFKIVGNILQYENISDDFINSIFEYIISNLTEFSEMSFNYYNVDRELYLDVLKDRISRNDIPATKKWLYLCNLPSTSDHDGSVKILKDVINQHDGISSYFVYPFAKYVAESVLEFIQKRDLGKNEK